MGRLERKLQEELKPGTRILLNYFPFKHWKLEKTKDNITTRDLLIETLIREARSSNTDIFETLNFTSDFLILVNTDISAEKISSENLNALYEKEVRRNEKNKVNMTYLLAI